MRIAIVHDYFIQMGGAEKVADELHSLFPTSDLVTTVDIYNRPGVITSWMRHLPITKKNHRFFFLLFPLAVESLDLTTYDLIISSSSGYAKGIRKRADAIHICYCHTPMRWVWRYDAYAERESFGTIARTLLPGLLWLLKQWDLAAAARPDHYIANSYVVAERIRRFYGRDSIVIPPPIDVRRFKSDQPTEDFFLVLSRLAPYKRLDLAVEACKALDKRLVVIGDGPARADLERIAGPKTEFLGRVSDELTAKYAARCQALIFPGEEDFGMTPLEINAAGRPVIAFKAGGATETVIDGTTGIFFDDQTVESLAGALQRFGCLSWDPTALQTHAGEFGTDVFRSAIHRFVESVLSVSPAAEGNPAVRVIPTRSSVSAASWT
jgi:glycosyltransferase involved in cell wall biosynthesis